jgi:NADH:ubiquinone oxidoreductase subunit C
MDTPALLQSAQGLLAPWIARIDEPETNRIDVYLESPDQVPDAVRAMFEAGGWHLSAITGLDVPQTSTTEGAIDLIYHFCKRAAVVSLRVSLPYGLPEVPTICGIIPSAGLYEREAVEMLGVIVTDTPIRTKIILPDDWPDWVYPLRKSFTGLDQD